MMNTKLSGSGEVVICCIERMNIPLNERGKAQVRVGAKILPATKEALQKAHRKLPPNHPAKLIALRSHGATLEWDLDGVKLTPTQRLALPFAIQQNLPLDTTN